MDFNIDEIKQKIEILKEMDKDFEIFGSSKHKYQLPPCKTEKEIQSFEKQHGISLPADYRSFLLHVGNGGAGPSYGMFKLEDYFDNSYAETNYTVHDNFLSDNFKFSINAPYTESQYGNEDDPEYDPADYFNDTAGSMVICHHGCGILNILIVSGEEKGKIWVDDRCNDNGLSRVSVSFYEWYSKWLDYSIASLETRNKLISELKKSADVFKITNITGLGRARGFSVSCSGLKEINKIYYYEDSEFLKDGKKTDLFRVNQEIKAALIIQDSFETKIIKQEVRKEFRQLNKNSPDKNDIKQMQDNAKTEFTGIITDIIWNSLNYKYYYICYAASIKKNIFIESRKDFELETGSEIYVSGILSFFVLKKYRKKNLFQKLFG